VPPEFNRANPRSYRRRRYWAADVIRELRRGQNFNRIAKTWGISPGAVSKIFRQATGEELLGLVLGLSRDLDVAGALERHPIAPITLTMPDPRLEQGPRKPRAPRVGSR
jgi:hypothetical protein